MSAGWKGGNPTSQLTTTDMELSAMANDHSNGSARPRKTPPQSRALNEHAARKQLAENLRVLRMLRSWSQEALAEAAELDRSYVGGIERAERNVSLDSLERLARAFGLTIPELLQPLDEKVIGERLLASIRKGMK